MAIADGLAINCSDLQAVGGTRLVAIRIWQTADAVVFGANHGITSILETASPATWGVYESRIESSSLTVSGTNEGKEFTTYECTLSFFVPGLTQAQFERLKQFDGDCLMVMVIDNNDATSGDPSPSASFASNKVFGVSDVLTNQDVAARTQQYARLVSVEGGTGAAFSDEIGVTVTIAATQFEIPRAYDGTITLGGTGLTLTTS
tara:strand:+ start:1850 stop:2461 length:612 start_codon:yes stop_codon:yes gene_type:complete